MKVENSERRCVIVGASHGGVNCAFALRRNGWQGEIILLDKDPYLPYHRPPLSKTFLKNEEGIEAYAIKPEESYDAEGIRLLLAVNVINIDRSHKSLLLDDGSQMTYDVLVLATGARAFVPEIPGLSSLENVFVMRSARDAEAIKNALSQHRKAKVVIIGGGYIGLESAASIRQLGAKVTVLEREDRILKRVTSPVVSSFFMDLHRSEGVEMLAGKNVVETKALDGEIRLYCEDGSVFNADILLIGVGVKVNAFLAQDSGLEVKNGIVVDDQCKTNDPAIFAIGDCTFHYNKFKNEHLRLESIQNAVDQAKVAAAVICGEEASYDSIPWFWSDQYDHKMQLVGLSNGYTDIVERKESADGRKLSVWYFGGDRLLAVDAVNDAKAYVMGTKLLKSGAIIDKSKLADPETTLKPSELVKEN